MVNIPFNSKEKRNDIEADPQAFDELKMIKEAESLRLKEPKQYWTIEQYKFWKGLNKTCWSPHMGCFVSDDYVRMEGLMHEIERVDKDAILRVVPQKKLEAETIAEIETAEGYGMESGPYRTAIDLGDSKGFYYVEFHIKRPKMPVIHTIMNRGKRVDLDPNETAATRRIYEILTKQVHQGVFQ